MTDISPYKTRHIIQYIASKDESDLNASFQPFEAFLVEEVPLTIFLNDQELVTLICSPNNQKELAVGFLLSEGMIQHHRDIQTITLRPEDGLVWIQTITTIPQTENFLRRNLTSCCGKGRASLYYVNDASDLEPVQATTTFSAATLLSFMAMLNQSSQTFQCTGGVHSAGLGRQKELLITYEDIGRHNAVDKILGYMLLHQIQADSTCLLLTGRISSEILIKAARAGIPMLVSRSAPTDLAVSLAQELHITLVGFARGNTCNIYSHQERIML